MISRVTLTHLVYMCTYFNRLPADHDYCRFQPVLLVGEITDIGDEMGV